MKSVTNVELLAIACLGLAIRSIISLHSYSGFGVAPMFGDYEAQRHWQEVTVNLKASEWYKNGTNNDLLYWGLDYPPLTAYHSYIMGQVARKVNESFVELGTSKGIESGDHKSFMRLTVLAADILVYIPAVLSMCICLDRTFQTNIKLELFIIFMLCPAQLLIDNGHFQYNNISLGLCIMAIAAILRDRHYLAAFAFTLALNYKQMELYHALPFFAYLLGQCLSQKSVSALASKFIAIATTVVATFILLWYPWLHSLGSTSQVLNRLFPVSRGVFEDKVANFWCSLNVVFKLKNKLLNHQMALICMGATLFFALPTNVVLLKCRNKMSFLWALLNTAAAFYLFSFQVHEKTILLVVLPACLLFNWWPREMMWFLETAVFSMVPLFKKDNLLLPSITLAIIFYIVYNIFWNEKDEDRNIVQTHSIKNISNFLMATVVMASVVLAAPSKFPDFWSLLIAVISCAHFMAALLFGNIQQIIGAFN
ncbi:probable dolichyl pyrophosphate Man9GlcNAc2 alpha-1,3-glucosyltransferase [Scaptodrosophila lebanonensis]|uniref:Alpha-1,3-glucosyltransferase n=1 Tax=Drosophila lebanonensis TaxID=7225 RepID=A0A6J2U9Z1_DROLE|nr:probable dolichyl pyrophosphate Man9GlcNAc2 alpha-1,3-glucosyltransferase [Scaptodrosophila lebanonensis]